MEMRNWTPKLIIYHNLLLVYIIPTIIIQYICALILFLESDAHL